ncbi:MAG: alpha/beta fold hydrolase [Chloroflexi bacterium]|nr:alpha/beta fold hydrolase [Chloroflexota bacterium]
MTRKEVSFYSDSVSLAADIYLPDNYMDGESRATIILLSGFWGTKGSSLGDEVGQYGARLLQEGYIIFRYDHPGFGSSGGERGRLFPLEQVEGIKDAVTFLQQRPEVNRERIGLLGASFGGGNVVYAVAVDHRVRCVVAINPVSDGEEFLRYEKPGCEWPRFLKRLEEDRTRRSLTGKSELVEPYHDVMWIGPGEEINKIAQRRYREAGVDKISLYSAEAIINYKPIDVVGRVTAPLLIIQAEKDSLVPAHTSIEMYCRAREPKRLLTFDCDHYDLFAPGQPVMEQSCLATSKWFLEHIPPG